jgi:cell division septum initiation protein DivIVA
MAFLDILADLSGVRRAIEENTAQQRRIADAIERLSPPLPEATSVAAAPASAREQGSGTGARVEGFYMAESPEEYQSRIDQEAALAMSLGVAPWSPAFQQAILEMKQDILKPRIETDEEGNKVTREYTSAEAEDILKEAFRLAQAAALAK